VKPNWTVEPVSSIAGQPPAGLYNHQGVIQFLKIDLQQGLVVEHPEDREQPRDRVEQGTDSQDLYSSGNWATFVHRGLIRQIGSEVGEGEKSYLRAGLAGLP
jgi:hypothetical protein